MKLPLSTYRLQMNGLFPLKAAQELIDYFEELGAATLYLSPLLQSKEKSLHGYDLVDPSHFNSEIGSEEELYTFSKELQKRGMSILLDIVPNHMSTDSDDNSWWNDLLEKGKNSRYAGYFDLFWEEIERRKPPHLPLPLLGGNLDEEIAAGNLQFSEEGGIRSIAYFGRHFPLSPKSTSSSRDIKELLRQQFYRLVPWQEATKELSYRRFFDVTTLACLSMEKEEVFRDCHKLVAKWLKEGVAAGLRVDHIDGLSDPQQYLERLRDLDRESYLVVEKIVVGEERLPPSWPVQGTTGYDYAARLDAIYVDIDGFSLLERIYKTFTLRDERFEEVAIEGKRTVMETMMRPEIHRLLLAAIELIGGGLEEKAVKEALLSLIAAFGVYRTYLGHGSSAGENDMKILSATLKKAAALSPSVPKEVWERLRKVLQSPEKKEEWLFITRLQQTTGSIMAKGVEDTAHYRYTPLSSLNEVGQEPHIRGDPLENFHSHNRIQSQNAPHTLIATTTHDSKRSEDVRARIALLSEIPARWEEKLLQWHSANNGDESIDRAHEYLLYQTLIGSWESGTVDREAMHHYCRRIIDYMIKAVKEEKRVTSWIDPNGDYEEKLFLFIEKLLAPNSPFVGEVDQFVEEIFLPGAYNSLSQLLLKATSPGIPDFYQGCELWNRRLVDPDNRGAVDFEERKALLKKLRKSPSIEEMMKEVESGMIKLYFTKTLLQLRKMLPELFLFGSYQPIALEGRWRHAAVAYIRSYQNKSCLVVSGRYFTKLTEIEKERWGDTTLILPESLTNRTLYDHIANKKVEIGSGRSLPLSSLFEKIPFALLEVDVRSYYEK